MYLFEMIEINDIDEKEYNSFENKTPFTTIPWLKFLSEDKNAIPKIVRITRDGELIGYFSGLLFSKCGIKIFGSPFKGWTTNYMGFDLYNYDLISDLVKPTIEFIMKETKCVYLELVDRHLTEKDLKDSEFKIDVVKNLEVDIDKSDEEILKSIKKDCKEFIRQFERRGATIEEVEPDDEFLQNLYQQLCEVFSKQDLVPPYSLDKLKRCVKYLKDTGMMLCLSVKEPQGKVIASYIYIGLNKKCIAWCTSSTREFQRLRPNEYMVWYGIRKFRDKGYKVFDFSGPRGYKYKWNPNEVEYVRITYTKYPFLIKIRDNILTIYWKLLKVKGYIKNKIKK